MSQAVRSLIKEHGTQMALAKALVMPDGSRVSQVTISLSLRGEQVGVTFARAIAMKLGIPVEELLSGKMTKPDGSRRYKELPGWNDAAAQVVEQQLLPRYIVETVGDAFVSFVTRPVDSAFIVDLGMMWIKYAPLEVRKDAEKANVLAQRARRLEEEEERFAAVDESGTRARDSHVAEVPALQRVR